MNKIQFSHNKKADLKYLSPSFALMVSALLFFIMLTILPVAVKIPLTSGAVFFWVICFISFLGGTILGSGNRFYMQLKTYPNNHKFVLQVIKLLVLVGIIGSILLLIDRYVLRGVSLDTDAMKSREILSQSSASMLSMISVIGYSIGIMSYMMIWVAELKQVKVNLWIKASAFFNVIIVIFVSVQLGSRSLLLVILISYLFAWFFTLSIKGARVKLFHIVFTFILIILMAIISSWLIVMRVDLMGLSMLDSISLSGYAEIIEPSEFIFDFLQRDNALTAFTAGLFSLVQYIFHGFYEFSLLFNSFSGEHEMGTRTFWLPLKVLSVISIGSIPIDVFDNSGVREGVYTTYVGPIFIDFGFLSPIVLFFNGLIIGLPFRWLMLGKLAWLPAATLVATGAILWPVVNIFESSSGAFLLFGSIVIGLLGECFGKNNVEPNRTLVS